MVKSLCMTLVYCPSLSLVEFQLGVKLDSISLPDICTESSESHTGFCNSGSDLIINVRSSIESFSQVGEFINNFKFLSIHNDGWFIVWQSFCADCEIIVIT